MNAEEWKAYEASWCDGNGRVVRSAGPVLPHGCPRCCTLCNVDRHQCPGCGEQLGHGVNVCLRCRNA